MDKHIKNEKHKHDLYRIICSMHDIYEQMLTENLDHMIKEAVDAAQDYYKIMNMDGKTYIFQCPYWFIHQYLRDSLCTLPIAKTNPDKDTYIMTESNMMLEFTVTNLKTDYKERPSLTCEEWNTERKFHVNEQYRSSYLFTLENQLYGILIGKKESDMDKYTMKIQDHIIKYNKQKHTILYKGALFNCKISRFTKRILEISSCI